MDNNQDVRVACDVGGTFTDFALIDPGSGALQIHKKLTTPADPNQAVLSGLDEFLLERDLGLEIFRGFVHGTTLVANALIERHGTKTALITTEGFADVLEIGREQLYNMYNIFLRFPEPLVPRNLRYEVPERIDRDGRVLISLDENRVREITKELKEKNVEAVAVCLLHAYRNDKHEKAIAQIIAAEWPDAKVSLSSTVAPEIREYERTYTTVANAYVQPSMSEYLYALEQGLDKRGFQGKLFPMLSSGGTTSVNTAITKPIHLTESGPAAGAVAAAFIGSLIEMPDLLSFDMGGTTAKLSLIRDGMPSLAALIEVARSSRFEAGSGIPLQTPSVELLEIGAGGGSIAWIDSLGLLKIGPESAGADPGPACYGLGGKDATVTDANVILGYIDPDYFLGGRMQLDKDAALNAVTRLAEKMGAGTLEAAASIHHLVNENMASAAQVHVIEKGEDPRRFSLVAFGGGGPLHGAGVNSILRSQEVICPPSAGVMSAIGLLVAPMSFEFVHSYPTSLDTAEWTQIDALFDEMISEGNEILLNYGYSLESIRVSRSVAARYRGQFHEVSIPLEPEEIKNGETKLIRERFNLRYQKLYGHLPEGLGIELLSWRAQVSGPQPELDFPKNDLGPQDASSALKGTRSAYFASLKNQVETSIYDRYSLLPGMKIEGPAIIEERESTILVYPNMEAAVDGFGNVRLTVNSQ